MTDSRINPDRHVVGPRRNPRDQAEEAIEEGMDRMQDEGGGVVEQNDPAGAPVLRNDLTEYRYESQIPDGPREQDKGPAE